MEGLWRPFFLAGNVKKSPEFIELWYYIKIIDKKCSNIIQYTILA